MTSVRGRVIVGLAAVAALLWLAIMERNLVLYHDGLAAALRGQTSQADSDLRGARLLNPDPTADIDRAVLKGVHGDFAGVVAGLRAVVRSDPANLTAWSDLAVVGRRHDPAAFREAMAALRRLDPRTASRAETGAPSDRSQRAP